MAASSASDRKRSGRIRGLVFRLLRSPLIALVSIGAGILCGLYFPQITRPLTPFAEVYLNLLKMIVLPLVVSSVIFSIRSLVRDPGSVTYLARLAVLVVAISLLSAMISGALTLVLQPGRIDPQLMASLGQLIRDQGVTASDLRINLVAPGEPGPTGGFSGMVLELVPDNIFNALASGNTIQVLVFCILFGLAVGRVPDSTSESFANALDAVFRACITLTEWFNWLLSPAMFVLVAHQTATTGLEPLRLMGGFLLALGLSAILVMAVSVAVVAARARQPLWTVIRAHQPLFMTTVATGSSMAAIPWIVSLLTRNLKFNQLVVELIVPLLSVVLRAGPIMLYVTGTIFIAQLYDRHLDIYDLVFITLASSLLGSATTGVSGPAMLLQMSVLCGYLRLPFDAAFVLFITLDTAIHQARTLSIVFTVTAAAAVIAPQTAGRRSTHGDTIALPTPASEAA